jgi:NAD(P)-dependent dehydrogenase (short-subunit alcohol dehydrogenase family)
MSMDTRRERNVVVVGAGFNSAALAYRLVEQGERVLYATTEAKVLPLLDAALREASLHQRLAPFQLAALDEPEVDRLFDHAADQLGQIAAVVSVQGAPVSQAAALHELDLGAFRERFEQGLRHAFLCARRALDELLPGGGGRLVHVLQPADAASSMVLGGALSAFVRSVAREYGKRGVACNGVQTRPAPRELIEPRAPRLSDLLLAAHSPLVESALFLASERASFVNGETLMLEDRL